MFYNKKVGSTILNLVPRSSARFRGFYVFYLQLVGDRKRRTRGTSWNLAEPGLNSRIMLIFILVVFFIRVNDTT